MAPESRSAKTLNEKESPSTTPQAKQTLQRNVHRLVSHSTEHLHMVLLLLADQAWAAATMRLLQLQSDKNRHRTISEKGHQAERVV